jgi:predicted nucleotidyltransferase
MSATLNLDHITETLRPLLEAETTIRAAYVFGSVSQGQATPSSDVDLGLLFEHKPSLSELLRIQNTLDEALGTPTDVVDLGSASAFLALDIIKGRRIYCRNNDAVDEFELYVLRRAGDLAPFERIRRAHLLGAST